jgi:two-component SAPR family response regulator
VEIFDEHIEHAQASDAQADAEQARRRYQAAADMYRGDFLEDMQEGGWQWRERERLRAACIEALRWIARDRAAASDHVAQRLAVERILEVAPFDLEAVKIRLDSLAREMRLTEAKRDYEQWRARYRAAVGAEAPQIWHQPEIAVPANA